MTFKRAGGVRLSFSKMRKLWVTRSGVGVSGPASMAIRPCLYGGRGSRFYNPRGAGPLMRGRGFNRKRSKEGAGRKVLSRLRKECRIRHVRRSGERKGVFIDSETADECSRKNPEKRKKESRVMKHLLVVPQWPGG